MQYLTRCRIELAARLLVEDPALSVSEVAYRCGFNSSQYFATVFRTTKGVSPSAFARRRAA